MTLILGIIAGYAAHYFWGAYLDKKVSELIALISGKLKF